MIYRIEGKFNGKDNTFTYELRKSNKTFTEFNHKNYINDRICYDKKIFFTYLFSKEELESWLKNCLYKPIRIYN